MERLEQLEMLLVAILHLEVAHVGQYSTLDRRSASARRWGEKPTSQRAMVSTRARHSKSGWRGLTLEGVALLHMGKSERNWPFPRPLGHRALKLGTGRCVVSGGAGVYITGR